MILGQEPNKPKTKGVDMNEMHLSSTIPVYKVNWGM